MPEASDGLWRDGPLRLLSIGRLTYYKGFAELMAVLAPCHDVQWVIAGDGELRGTLLATLARLRAQGHPCHITLAGPVSETQKQQLLAGCDVFCLPSIERTEAFGVTVLEAMAHAKPCLVADLHGSGLPWLVQSSGCGVVARPDAPQAWLAALDALKDAARRQAWGRCGYQALQNRFAIGHSAAGVEAIYRLVLEEADAALGALADTPLPHRGLVVIPAKNEAPTVAGLVRQLQRAGYSQVLVVDDHSADGTGALAQQAGAMVVRPALPLGAWGAMQTGIRYGVRHGFAWVVTMDADGQHPVSEIDALIQSRHLADVLIGSQPERISPLRQMAWAWFRWLSGARVRDLTSGFRLYNAPAMRLACANPATLLDYQDMGALLILARAGMRLQEVPVRMKARQHATSRIFDSWRSVARYMLVTTIICMTFPRTRR